jgi:xanthine dehydrogenase YagS FAD-binding subunit
VRDVDYLRVSEPAGAVAALAAEPGARLIAGGTELVNLMKEHIAEPALLVDISRLPLTGIEAGPEGLRIGALARMSDVAAHPAVRRHYPAIAQALELSASPQLRNMATMGGNLLQRTRCPYFRAERELPCEKRRPGSGCSAREGEHRTAAIIGTGPEHRCVAAHPSDLAVALAALDAVVQVLGADGARELPVRDLHRLPGDRPEEDHVLAPGELITGLTVPAAPDTARSRYLKVRERASYEFALVSAAAAVELDDETVVGARLALGAVSARPWRLPATERALAGVFADEAVLRNAVADGLEEDLAEAAPLPGNVFKLDLARRAAARVLVETVLGERDLDRAGSSEGR